MKTAARKPEIHVVGSGIMIWKIDNPRQGTCGNSDFAGFEKISDVTRLKEMKGAGVLAKCFNARSVGHSDKNLETFRRSLLEYIEPGKMYSELRNPHKGDVHSTRRQLANPGE